MTGLFGSQMSCPNMFKVIMSIKTEKKALELAKWILAQTRLKNGQFPSQEEVMQRAGGKAVSLNPDVRSLHSLNNDSIGKFSRKTSVVTLYPGANVKTIAHEIGWYAT